MLLLVPHVPLLSHNVTVFTLFNRVWCVNFQRAHYCFSVCESLPANWLLHKINHFRVRSMSAKCTKNSFEDATRNTLSRAQQTLHYVQPQIETLLRLPFLPFGFFRYR
uniref:(northern house mosquito) hypothetical protein n=1 Tax=Culex pipiens TaxID=7175 RepID=A0A8D8II52_CULPI